jgi:hypothetical protein
MEEAIKAVDEAVRQAIAEHPLWKAGDVDEGDLRKLSKLLMDEIAVGNEIADVIDDIMSDYFYEVAYDDDYTTEVVNNITYDFSYSYETRDQIASEVVSKMWEGVAYDVALSDVCEKTKAEVLASLAEAKAERADLNALSSAMDRDIYRGLLAERRVRA